MTAYSWLSMANGIELCGAQPVFVDIQSDSFNIDPACLERSLQRLMAASATAQRVKATLPVHIFGQLANRPAILELANHYAVPVIEDAACPLEATWHSCQAGTWGIMSCFSFHPRKAITTGEGGIVTTENPELVRRLQTLRNHGMDPDALTPGFIMPGFNDRMTEFQAALGHTQMHKLECSITARCRLAAYYDVLLAGIPLQTPIVTNNGTSVYQSYVVQLLEQRATYRQSFIRQFKEKGTETSISTWHIPMTTSFRRRYGYKTGDFPETDCVFARAMTLPLYEELLARDQQHICDVVCDVLQGSVA